LTPHPWRAHEFQPIKAIAETERDYFIIYMMRLGVPMWIAEFAGAAALSCSWALADGALPRAASTVLFMALSHSLLNPILSLANAAVVYGKTDGLAPTFFAQVAGASVGALASTALLGEGAGCCNDAESRAIVAFIGELFASAITCFAFITDPNNPLVLFVGLYVSEECTRLIGSCGANPARFFASQTFGVCGDERWSRFGVHVGANLVGVLLVIFASFPIQNTIRIPITRLVL